jgi:serine/threonine-protein kinase
MASEPEASPDPADIDPLVGTKVAKYEILRRLGHGGMGRVYEALNPDIGKRVALKMLDPRLASNKAAAARFAREAQAASAASSPHIVEIFDAGVADDGTPFIVMEVLEGESLASRIDREGGLDPDETVRIAIQILRGLHKAHEAGIVHRDLKPDNVFLVDRDHEPPLAKILDFGVSKVEKAQGSTTLTRDGSVIGTPAYMSPEQAQGQPDVDAQSDIWSVGAIVYECLSGRLPFSGTSYEQVIVQICTEAPAPLAELAPTVPRSLVDIVERCMRRDRSERIGSADELLQLLGEPASGSRRSRAAVVRSARAVSGMGTDSTVEAPGVMMDDSAPSEAADPRSSRSALLIGVVVLAASVALAFWSLSPNETASPLAASSEPLARGASSGDSAPSATAEVASAPASAQASAAPPVSAAPLVSAAPSASVASAGPPAPRWRPPKSAPPPPAPSPSHAPPPPPPRGIAPDLVVLPE